MSVHEYRPSLAEAKRFHFAGAEGSTISLTLRTYQPAILVVFILMPGLPAKDTIINAVYSYAFAAFDTNNYYPKIIAKDKNGNADTMTDSFVGKPDQHRQHTSLLSSI